MDFQKAFDKVPHTRLIRKLQAYGIHRKIMLWITDFLDERQFKVTVNVKLSSWHDALSGIPQGSILGPLLLIIYINDLPDVCNNLHANLYIYADDTKLQRHIYKSEHQNKLHRVTDWASEWLLKLIVDKCCSISFIANVSSLCNTQNYIENSKVCHELTRSSAIVEGPHDASCQLKSCQLPRHSAETTCTTSPEQIEVIKLEGSF